MPPPIPQSKSFGTTGSSFSFPAAKCSVIAPVLLFTLTLIIEPVLKSGHRPETRLAFYIYAAVSCLILVGGLVLGILALVLALVKPGERAPTIITAVAGLGLTALFLGIFIPNFVRGREKAIAQRKNLEEVQEATAQFQKQSLKAIDEGRPTDVSALKQSVDKAASESTGDDAAFMKVLSADLQKFQGVQGAYNDAFRQLTTAHVLRTSDLTEREQLKTRKMVIQTFLDANENLEKFIKSHEQILRDELVHEHISEKDTAVAMGAFRKKSGDQTPLLIEVRQTDRRIGNAMLQVLELLDANWGQWHYNTSKGKVIFQDTATAQKFNAALKEITSAGADQAVAQQKLKGIIAQQTSME